MEEEGQDDEPHLIEQSCVMQSSNTDITLFINLYSLTHKKNLICIFLQTFSFLRRSLILRDTNTSIHNVHFYINRLIPSLNYFLVLTL